MEGVSDLSRFCHELDDMCFSDMRAKSKPDEEKSNKRRKRIIGEKGGA